MSNPTGRFSDRVADYQKYRPSYPTDAVMLLVRRCAINSQSVIADIGSGTGIFSNQLLATGARVIGVEPNDAMREAGERILGNDERFRSVNGAAEATKLADASVDLITVAQAFHWFDATAFRTECLRVLKQGGYVAMLWNDRLTEASPFLVDYEKVLLRHGTDYQQVNHQNVSDAVFRQFFGYDEFVCDEFPNEQRFDWEGLWGRVRSSSYTPSPEEPGFAAMAEAVREIFDRHADSGEVVFEYRTVVYIGTLQ